MKIKREGFLNWLVDPVRPTTGLTDGEYRFAPELRTWAVPTAIGVGLLLVSAVALLGEETRARFFFSYLVAYSFILSITLGALFFVMIQHLTKAEWSVVLRRIPESLMWSFPLLAVMTIPILLGMHELYHWTHEELLDPQSPQYDALIAFKTPYLNIPFFIARLILYFGIWTYLAYKLYALSLQQDLEQDPMIPVLQRRFSAWGVIVFALTLAFASFDLLMSLDPHWFSTIFGVYFFSGSFLSALATITLICVLYGRTGLLKGKVTREHYHDLGKFMFAFVVFWAYIAFSQYMLIWYANIPEETIWYRHRMEGGWLTISLILGAGHFVIPFFILIARSVKRALPILSFMCVWILFFHYLDLYWITMPVLDHYVRFHPLDVSLWLAFVGIFSGLFIYRLGRHSITPYRDPRFARSIKFENV